MTLKTRLESAANSFHSIAKRVDETGAALRDYQSQPKELQGQFTDLVDRIFSWQGWGMHDSGRGSEDFKALVGFLGPNGILLDCVNKLQFDQFLTFPLVKQASGPDEKETTEQVDAFAYYFTRFAAFVTKTPLAHGRIAPENHIYHELLAQYLHYYLPLSGRFPHEIAPLSRHEANMSSPKSRSSARILRKDLHRSKSSDLSESMMLNRSGPSSVSRTHKLLEILGEWYLQVKQQSCPLEDQLRALRVTVKHLHSISGPSETDQCAAVASFILSEFYEPKMTRLITHCTEHWPVEVSFRLVLETFLSYVQPWRYRAGPDEVSSTNART